MLRGVCYFFGVIFILGGLLFLVSYPLLPYLGIGAMIIGIILIAIGHKAGGGNGGRQGGGDSDSGGGKRSWGLTEEERKRAQQHWWYFNVGPGKKR